MNASVCDTNKIIILTIMLEEMMFVLARPVVLSFLCFVPINHVTMPGEYDCVVT